MKNRRPREASDSGIDVVERRPSRNLSEQAASPGPPWQTGVPPSPASRQYVCPGETHPISRGVHLARLASYYPACRQCPHRCDAGGLPDPSVEAWLAVNVPPPSSVFQTEGVRGKWLNELTRSRAVSIAEAFGSLLWDRAPIGATFATPELGRRPTRPTVILAADERTMSPAMVSGAAAGLRRFGCQVIDIGQVSGPCFQFAVRHLGASGGLFVTGSGGDPSITGVDFAGPGGAPVSRWGEVDRLLSGSAAGCDATIDLAEIESRCKTSVARPARISVPPRAFDASLPYSAGLRRHFHALRPLTVVCAGASTAIRSTLETLFASLPCRFHDVELPCRPRDVGDPRDPDVSRTAAALRETQSSLGVLIDDDGRRCAFLDERSALLDWSAVATILAGRALDDRPRSAVVVEPGSGPLAAAVRRRAGRVIESGGTLALAAAAMDESAAVFGGGSSCRYWHRDEWPVCDAIVTLGRMLEALSQGDRPLSEVAAAALA